MDHDTLEITDLPLAAYLTTRGHTVLRVDGRPGRRVFHFPRLAAEACRDYFQGATVGALAFAEAFRNMKALIHNVDLMR